MLAQSVNTFLPKEELLNYFDAILRVYNRHGRRDNKYKARIKILVKDLTVEGFAKEVNAEWQHLRGGPGTIRAEAISAMTKFFEIPAYQSLGEGDSLYGELGDSGSLNLQREFTRWKKQNVSNHQYLDYAIVTLSLKKAGVPPGDATARQMDFVAELADRFSLGEVRVTHEQNLLLPHVPRSKLYELWNLAAAEGLATPNIGLLTDVVCCPGGDFCSLANAKSIPVAVAIQKRFDDLDYLFDLGPLELNISGCVNSCGHHHIGHIGILGVDKNNEEWYQITLGGREGNASHIGKVIGPSFAANDIPDVIERIIGVYIANRHEDEIFIDTFSRIGVEPFKTGVYGAKDGSTH